MNIYREALRDRGARSKGCAHLALEALRYRGEISKACGHGFI